MLQNYELALILSAKLAEDKQKKILGEIDKYIKDISSKSEGAKLLGKKRFAYPIKHETEGFYYTAVFTSEGKETAGLSTKLKLNEGVLRYLILKK